MRQTTAEVLVEEYRPLVRWIAQKLKRRVSHRAEIDDLMQAGMEGLIKAAPRYKPESGASFITFASYGIRGAMLDALRETDWAPRSVARATREIAKAIRLIEVREQRPARESEVAAHLGLALNEYRAALLNTHVHHVFSMEEMPGCLDTAVTPDNRVDDEDEFEKIRAAVASLPERERYVIEQCLCGLTLLEVGQSLGVTESRMCQLRTQGIARLRARLMGTDARRAQNAV